MNAKTGRTKKQKKKKNIPPNTSTQHSALGTHYVQPLCKHQVSRMLLALGLLLVSTEHFRQEENVIFAPGTAHSYFFFAIYILVMYQEKFQIQIRNSSL